MDPLINPATADYAGERTTSLANAVYVRLMTPLGTWWAEPEMGSRLHELNREKDLDRIYILARQYAEQALRPILTSGRAQAIRVTAERVRRGWCLLLIDVTDLSGQVQHFKHHVAVA